MIKDRIFVHLDKVISPDVCVLVADFFMRVDSATWSIVSGIHGKKLIVIFRYNGLQRSAGRTASKTFGDVGSAGGHKSMARAEIPFSELTNHVDVRDDKALRQWVIHRFEKGTSKKNKAG